MATIFAFRNDRAPASLGIRRIKHGCASSFGDARCELKVGHNFAHSATVDGGLLSWENPYAPDGRTIAAQRTTMPLPDGYEALLQA